jgi:hypothetical protein
MVDYHLPDTPVYHPVHRVLPPFLTPGVFQRIDHFGRAIHLPLHPVEFLDEIARVIAFEQRHYADADIARRQPDDI